MAGYPSRYHQGIAPNHPHRRCDSPLCGPGVTSLWLLLTLSLLLTWTLHRKKARQDGADLLLLALFIPVLAGLHEAYLVYTYPGNRYNLIAWYFHELDDVNYSVLNNHIICRTSLLIQCLILMPLCAYRKHGIRTQVLCSFLGAPLVGFFSMEMFRFRVGESLVYIGQDEQDNEMWAQSYRLILLVEGLYITACYAIMHLITLLPRAIWRRYRRTNLGYWDLTPTTPWNEPQGWRGFFHRYRNKLAKQGWRLGLFGMIAHGIVYPAAILWGLMPHLRADYQANLQLFHEDGMLRQKLLALQLTLLPRSDGSIRDWEQLSLLVLGLGIFTFVACDVWAKRSSGIATDIDSEELKLGKKEDY
jgi:hypothetical protein